MDTRIESAISVCVMYALFVTACVGYAMLGTGTAPCTRGFQLLLPIFVQVTIAEAVGLGPLMVNLAQTTHCAVLYFAILASSFFVLYWIGWWIGELNDERAGPSGLRRETGQLIPEPADPAETLCGETT
jgi:hypothetical protein